MPDILVGKSVEEMKDELEAHYEAAGFSDFREVVLSDMDEKQVKKCYLRTFEIEEAGHDYCSRF